MKIKFKEVTFRQASLTLIECCDQIIEEYQADGLRLTLRQLYYQLVSKNIIVNAERSYQNLSALVTNARLAGLLDWDAIEDRVRQPQTPQEFDNIQTLVNAALRAYRLPRWKGQENYIELWVEKDALAGVLRPIASEYHITLMVNRGYSSASAMYESANRFIEGTGNGGDGERTCVLLYLGDHDPSGEDMVRDVRDRLAMFGANVVVRKLALTMDQVKKYNPPPNPAKVSDPRAADYIKKFGDSSWEVDALPPRVLAATIRKALDAYVDKDLMEEVREREEKDKKYLRKAVEAYARRSE